MHKRTKVRPFASQDLSLAHRLCAVRKAYRKRVLETHPDKLDVTASEEEKQAAEREFQKVNPPTMTYTPGLILDCITGP